MLKVCAARHLSKRASGRRRPRSIRGRIGPVGREHSRSRHGLAKGRLADFDPKAKPYTADEIRKERELYRTSSDNQS